jgi:hypothetical protein
MTRIAPAAPRPGPAPPPDAAPCPWPSRHIARFALSGDSMARSLPPGRHIPTRPEPAQTARRRDTGSGGAVACRMSATAGQCTAVPAGLMARDGAEAPRRPPPAPAAGGVGFAPGRRVVALFASHLVRP